MVSDALRNARDIRRKDHIPDEDRTEARDAAAEDIERLWPATLTEIAAETEWSRQHIANTLERYFVPVQTGGRQVVEVPIDVPAGGEVTLEFQVTIRPQPQSGDSDDDDSDDAASERS